MDGKRYLIQKVLLAATVSGIFAVVVVCFAARLYMQRNKQQAEIYVNELAKNMQYTIAYELNPSLTIIDAIKDDQKDIETFKEISEKEAKNLNVVRAVLMDRDEVIGMWPNDIQIDTIWINGEENSISFAHNLVERSRSLLVGGPLSLEEDGEKYFAFFHPMSKNGAYSGQVITFVPTQQFINRLNLERVSKLGFEYTFWRLNYENGQKIMIDSSNEDFDFSNGIKGTFYIPGEWNLILAPKDGWLGDKMSLSLLGAAVLIEAILLLLFYQISRYKQMRNEEMQRKRIDVKTGFYTKYGLKCELESIMKKPGRSFTLFLFSVNDYCRFDQLCGEQAVSEYLGHVKKIIDLYVMSEHRSAYLGCGNLVVAVMEEMALGVAKDMAKGLSIELIWKVNFDDRQYATNSGYEILRYPDDVKESGNVIEILVQRYYDRVHQEQPIVEMTRKVQELIRGEENVVFRDYSDNYCRKLSQTIKQYSKKVEQLAYIDTFFRVGNRSKYLRDCRHMIEYHTEKKFSCYCIDICSFSKYNELFGNEVGDRILFEMSRRLGFLFRDRLYRINGDVFLGIYLGEDKISSVMDLLRHYIQEPIEIESYKFNLKIKCGICCYPEHASSPEELLSLSQTVVRAIKKSDKLEYAVCGKEFVEQLRLKAEISETLKDALESHTLEVWYQPIMDVQKGEYVTLEALLRLKNRNGGYHRVDMVLAVAEHQHMIDQISDYVLDEVCRFMKQYAKMYGITRVNINYMPYQFMNDRFAENILGKIEYWGIEPEAICLEVIESSLIQSIDTVREVLEFLRSQGISIALDDFGVGYSSLNLLAGLPVNILKVDRSLVRQLPEHPKQRNLLQLIVDIADLYHMSIVAEGVETSEELAEVTKLGVHLIQGFYYSRPRPESEVIEVLEEKNKKRSK